MKSRKKTLCKYVVPTILGSVSYFLFTIVDGIFVGHGVGTDALGAVNIAFPFVMVVCASFMLTTIGGVTVTAIRLGRGKLRISRFRPSKALYKKIFLRGLPEFISQLATPSSPA